VNVHKQPAAKKPHKTKQRGPKAETLVIEGIDWKEAVKRSFEKEKPSKGWPTVESKKKSR